MGRAAMCVCVCKCGPGAEGTRPLALREDDADVHGEECAVILSRRPATATLISWGASAYCRMWPCCMLVSAVTKVSNIWGMGGGQQHSAPPPTL